MFWLIYAISWFKALHVYIWPTNIRFSHICTTVQTLENKSRKKKKLEIIND
jgi:hypothetical protein